MPERFAAICGIGAPLLYGLIVAVGAVFTPDHSHVRNAVSELVGTGAPIKAYLEPFLILYNLGLIGFGAGLPGVIETDARRSLSAGAWSLALTGFLGLVMTLFFPADLRGVRVTFLGTMHLVFAALISLGTMETLVLTGVAFRKAPAWEGYASYSFASAAVVLVSGALAAAGAVTDSPFMGLAERIALGAFLQWVFVVAWRALRKS